MRLSSLLSLLLAIGTHAQSSETTLSGSGSTPGSTSPSASSSASSIANLGGDLVPTGTQATYYSYTSTSTIISGTRSGSISLLATAFASANGSSFPTSSPSSTSRSVTLLQGSAHTTTLNSTATSNSTATVSTSTSAAPTNTQPCNNYPEFCTRKYSNITYIGAHNSPFVNPNNAGANQALRVIDQLNDGIRMLQGQTHWVNNTIFYCHTSCDLLNAGTAQEYFTNVSGWIATHPYDVVTILIGNADFVGVGNYTQPLEASGLAKWAYTPPRIPMAIDDWPSLSELILTQKRAVIFMDYNANQTQVPYILDEFSQMWETPFSPTDDNFPCTQQRPPNLKRSDAEQRMYMANHNLNTKISFAGTSLLVPTTVLLNQTNAVTGPGSLGRMADDCAALWPRPPNFLLVDYYNRGPFPGSVFEVAAQHNNVTYSRPCCGLVPSSANTIRRSGGVILLAGAVAVALVRGVW